MGSFSWNNNQCYVQYHNGRPLSIALTEPCDCQRIPCMETDFALQYHPRSHSSGRRYQRESYRVYHPNVQYTSFCSSPSYLHRSMDHSSSKDAFVEKFETVTIEEQKCRPTHSTISYVCAPSPPVRQIKIRSRPSSCVDLHHREATDNPKWTKYVEEKHEENYNYHYNYNLPSDRTVTIQQESSPSSSSSKAFHQDITATRSSDINIPIISTSVRRSTRDVGTSTAGLARRPLSVSETQVIERYEKKEKVRRDSLTDSVSSNYITTSRPIQRPYENDDFVDKYSQQASRKIQRKDFVQRMHARNGIASKTYNSLNLYSDRGKNKVIIRPTSKPREALVDTAGIIASPGDTSEPTTPITIENSSRSRYYFQST